MGASLRVSDAATSQTRQLRFSDLKRRRFLESIRVSEELGCGCIPMVPAHELAQRDGVTDNTGPHIDELVRGEDELEGYTSLIGQRPVYKSHISAAYKSTWVGSPCERNFANLNKFVEEVEELLGERGKKDNLIIRYLEAQPQAQLQAVIHAYDCLASAYRARAGKLGMLSDEGRGEGKKQSYYQSIWGTLVDIRTNRDMVDVGSLLRVVEEVRSTEVEEIRQSIRQRVSMVALAIWIAREKAKQNSV